MVAKYTDDGLENHNWEGKHRKVTQLIKRSNYPCDIESRYDALVESRNTRNQFH